MNTFNTDKTTYFASSDLFVSAISTDTPQERILSVNLHTGWCLLKVDGLYAPVVFLGSNSALSWLAENGFSSSHFSAASFQPAVGNYITL